MPPNPARPAKDIDRPPYMVKLGLMPPYMAEDVEKAYLAKIKDIRPDLGGDPQPFYDIQTAYMQAKEYVKFRGDRRGWIARQLDEYMAVQEVLERLKQLGASVESVSLDWLEKSFGDFAELTEKIHGITLHDHVDGDQFIDYLVQHREQLLELRRLDLAGCGVTDSSVRHLSVFRRLQELDLSRTPVSWEATHLVQWLPELYELKVDGTSLNWFTRRKLANQLRKKRKAAEALRAIHPTTVR
jgi:hypothetical protein